MSSRRGQITAPILGLILLAIAVIIVTTITFVGLSIGAATASSTLDALPSFTERTVETFTALVNQSVQVGTDPIVQGTLRLTNSTGAEVGLSNFTIDYTAGLFTLITASVPNNTVLTANFTQGYPAVAAGLGEAVVQTSGVYGDYVQYLPLVIVVLLLTLIISALVGVIFMFFGAFGQGNSGSQGGAM